MGVKEDWEKDEVRVPVSSSGPTEVRSRFSLEIKGLTHCKNYLFSLWSRLHVDCWMVILRNSLMFGP